MMDLQNITSMQGHNECDVIRLSARSYCPFLQSDTLEQLPNIADRPHYFIKGNALVELLNRKRIG